MNMTVVRTAILGVSWKTAILGVPAMLGGLSTIAFALGPIFHSLAIGHLSDLVTEWPALAAGVAALSTGFGLFYAKDYNVSNSGRDTPAHTTTE